MRSTARHVAGLTAALTTVWIGCSFDTGGVPFEDDAAIVFPDGAMTADARPGDPDGRPNPADARPGDPDAALPPDAGCAGDVLTVSYSNIDPCDIPTPLGSLTLNDNGIWYLSTDTGTLSDGNTTIPVASALVAQAGGGPMVRVVAVTSLTIASAGDQISTLAAYGTHPLVIVSFGNATIDGFLYAGADEAVPGPGGSSPACGSGTGTPGAIQSTAINGDGGAGGGGGSYGTRGANGGKVGGATGNASPTAAGSTSGNASIVPLRGGCAGGAGGNGGGPGGAGGGAVQLIAEGAITINGFVTARGGGGSPPLPATNQPAAGGGGGGGSGGALLLEGASVTISATAIVVAHGGGGGQGTRSGGVSFGGAAGENGHSGDALGAAGGDSGVSAGGIGGNGAAAPAATVGAEGTSSTGTAGGGGGGGGGLGRIRVNTPNESLSPSAIISPSAT